MIYLRTIAIKTKVSIQSSFEDLNRSHLYYFHFNIFYKDQELISNSSLLLRISSIFSNSSDQGNFLFALILSSFSPLAICFPLAYSFTVVFSSGIGLV